MIFSSKTPRDLNHDPEPYLLVGWMDESGVHYYRSGRADLSTWPVVHDPRPEFDHAQHNEPNPILVEFRNDVVLNPTIPVRHLAMIWVDRDLFAFEVEGATLAHADHARRVLVRLANLTKEN